MKLTRSSKTALKFATQKKRNTLQAIMVEYCNVVNAFIEMFWGKHIGQKDLLKDIINAPTSWLTARMRQCAAREAVGMIESAKLSASEKDLEPVKPRHTGKKMILSAQIVTIEKGRNSFDLWLALASVGKSIKLYLPLKKHRHFNWFLSWKISNSVVIHQDYVQFSFEKEIGEKKNDGKDVGIDVGINHLLATSERDLLGNQVKPLINVIKRRKQGSKNYKRAKRTLSYFLHKTVKDFFKLHDLRLVVVEKLHGLKQGKRENRSKEFRKTLSNWNYRELLKIIELRSEENRVSFRSVSPYKTSQQCPRSSCSHTEQGNRSGENFRCLKCGFSDNADFVGARNILDRFISGPYGAAFQPG